MIENVQISSRQLMFLIVFTILPTAVLFVPAITAAAANEDAWLSTVTATAAGLALSLIVTKLASLYPDKSLDLFSKDIVGRILGMCIAILYFWFFLHGSSIVLREYVEYLSTAVLPETPLPVLIGTILFLAAITVRCGLEVISRLAEIIFPILMSMIGFVLLCTILDVDWSGFLPIIPEEPKAVLHGAYTPFSWLGEVVMAAFLIPHMKRRKDSNKIVLQSISLIGIILTAAVLIAIGVFSSPEVARMQYPMFELARFIQIDDFLERVGWLISSLWILGVFLKVTIFYYAAVLVAARLFRLNAYKPLVFPCGLLIMLLSIWLYGNIIELVDFLSVTWPSYSLILFEAGIPLGLLLTALIRRRGRSKSG
ncbi:GerAB/ArcD/ProY family transporter [Paenibacillus sp. strain BS8-2]